MTALINSMLLSTIDNHSLVDSSQVMSLLMLVVFLVGKLLTAAADKSRFAQVLNRVINAPLVSLFMVFMVIALLRAVLIIQQ